MLAGSNGNNPLGTSVRPIYVLTSQGERREVLRAKLAAEMKLSAGTSHADYA